MSSRLASLLYATIGGSGNASFIRSDACSVGRCLRKMLLMFGRPLENVFTSGTLFERFSRPLTSKSSSRSLVSTFVSSFSTMLPRSPCSRGGPSRPLRASGSCPLLNISSLRVHQGFPHQGKSNQPKDKARASLLYRAARFSGHRDVTTRRKFTHRPLHKVDRQALVPAHGVLSPGSHE